MAASPLFAGIPTEGGSSPVFIVLVATFMVIAFLLTLVMALRSWNRGWPENRLGRRSGRDQGADRERHSGP